MIFDQKYRPRQIRDLVSNDDSIFIIFKIFKKIGLFNLIISGSTGSGKNSLIFSLFNNIFYNSNSYEFVELYGIEDYKMKDIKQIIWDFLENKFSLNVNKKIIIIKDSDFFSFQSQLYLRKYLENISKLYNFWLLCKCITKINNAISSRCVRIVLKKQGFIKQTVRIKEILDKENLKISLELVEKLIVFGKFSFRLTYNCLIECLILYSNRKIKSLIIKKEYNNHYKKIFFKNYLFKEDNFEYIIKNNLIKIKNKSRRLISLEKNWFFLNNPIFLLE
jgi:DNA polymerase III delta prime subunit